MAERSSRYVDRDPAGVPVGHCVVLPGRQYTADHPLLFFAAEVALSHDWHVRQVFWEPEERFSRAPADEMDWVCAELGAATDGLTGTVLVVAKSLGTLAAPLAASRDYPAAWLTPLLADPPAAAPLLTYPAAQFTLIGSEDPYLDLHVFDTLPGERLLVAGDHVLRVPYDPLGMVTSHERFVRTFDTWLRDLRPT